MSRKMAPILILFLAAMAYCGPINNLNSLPPNQSAEMNPNPMMTPPSNSQMTPTLPPVHPRTNLTSGPIFSTSWRPRSDVN